MLQIWKSALAQRGFRLRLAIMIVTHTVFSIAFANFVGFVERRPGVVYTDPFLGYLPRADVTWPTFILIYGAVLISFWSLRTHPERMVLTFQTWSSMLMVRMLAMWLLPLEPPVDIIPLADPVAELVFGTSTPATRDLFFSGHTSTMLILSLAAVGRWRRVLFFAMTAAVATFVLVQRVHYTIDVVAAPFFVAPLYFILAPYYLRRREAVEL